MSHKYHISKNGKPGLCTATKRPCLLQPAEAPEPSTRPRYAVSEQRLSGLFTVGQKCTYQGKEYHVLTSQKPSYVGRGEGKTDVYLLLISNDGDKQELKISYKQSNAQFMENKPNAARMEAMLGAGWRDRVKPTLEQIAPHLKQAGSTLRDGSLILGYRFDVMNCIQGSRSAKLELTDEEKLEVYSGARLPADKRDGLIAGERVRNSGVATHMLEGDDFATAQDVLDALQPMKEYAKDKELWLAAKAVGLNADKKKPGHLKFESGRPLAYQWKYSTEAEPVLVYDNPLTTNSSQAVLALPESVKRPFLKA